MKPYIIVMSHGNLAKEILASAQMIVGEMERISSICMSAEDGLVGTQEKLDKILETVAEEVLVIADLMGGTPANVALMKSADDARIKVVTGMNLGMIMEAVMSSECDLNALGEAVEEVGRTGVQFVQSLT